MYLLRKNVILEEIFLIDLVYQSIFKLKKVGKWVPLCCTLGAVWIIIIYYRSVEFESNDNYRCIRKTILNEDDLSA
ncbi:Uncharacterized protein FWK35_00026068 [Aphis craccivora]|uniref:Uncharacterized protein n=1 Tax=Aphis craccivora TaxID=307492 RepID=A0A6G0Y4K0_APHCR|nr:Uncharacterized protein FWK35_00026068 [Aphis craccivora]